MKKTIKKRNNKRYYKKTKDKKTKGKWTKRKLSKKKKTKIKRKYKRTIQKGGCFGIRDNVNKFWFKNIIFCFKWIFYINDKKNISK